MFLAYAIIGCGGSKEGLVLDGETPESILQKSETAYENGDYEKSLDLSQVMMDHFPTSDLHIDAQLLISKTLGAQEKYEEQFDLLLRVLKENIIPEKVPGIYLQIAEFYENSAKWNPGTVTSDSADFSNAANYYKKAVFYPNSQDRSTKAQALYRMALMHAKINELETASKAYQELIATYPASPYSTLARAKLVDPSNTSELALPESVAPETEAPVVPGVAEEAVEQPLETTEETLLPIVDDSEKIELPADDAEEPTILDSIQTIDDDAEVLDTDDSERIELPADDTEMPSLLDSIQTIDDDEE